MQADTVGVLDGGSTPMPATAATSGRVLTRTNIGIAAGLFVVALVVIFALQRAFGINSFGVSDAPHWIYQASSFLHGRWNVDLPPTVTDIRTWHGKDYLFYPPLPALVMMPLVAIWGLHTSDILFTTVMSALNLSLLFLIFEQARTSGLSRRATWEHVVWAILLYFGSIFLWLSLGGRVWFTSQMVTVTFVLLALWAALAHHYTLGALCLGLAVLGRAPVVVTFIYIFYLAWEDAGRQPLLRRFLTSLWRRKPDWQAVPWQRILPVVCLCLAAVAAYAFRNYATYGSPTETGYALTLKQDFPNFHGGVLSLSYMPTNFFEYFFTFPHVTVLNAIAGHLKVDMLNGSQTVGVFVTTPLFLLLFARNRKWEAIRAWLWVPIVLFLLSILAFFANGYSEFGARYLLEVYPFAFLMLILSEVRTDWRIVLLGLIAIAINVAGAYQFWTGRPIFI